jgi:malonyl-CoA/methylmalonyl-CoA synthetase
MPEEAAVIAALRVGLAKFKLPKRIIAIDELPRNAMGKVQKSELRRRFANVFAAQP